MKDTDTVKFRFMWQLEFILSSIHMIAVCVLVGGLLWNFNFILAIIIPFLYFGIMIYIRNYNYAIVYKAVTGKELQSQADRDYETEIKRRERKK